MGNLSNKVNEIMESVYNNGGPSDATALEGWKSGILGIEGINPDVEVTLSPEGDQYGRNSFIDDPVFKDREEKISKSISSTYGKGEYEGD